MPEKLESIIVSKRSEDLATAGAPAPQKPAEIPNDSQLKSAVEAQIDGFLIKVGYTDPTTVTDEHGWRFFQLGSANGRAGVVKSEEDLFLRVEASVMPLPSDKDLILPLMREVLELNLTIPSEGKIGIMDETVFVAVTRRIEELHEDDVALCIHSVMSIADSIDDILIKKYGGTSKKRNKPNKVKPEKPESGSGTTVIDDPKEGVLKTVFEIIKSNPEGISKEMLLKRTEFGLRQMSNALYKLSKSGKIKPVERGIYIAN